MIVISISSDIKDHVLVE